MAFKIKCFELVVIKNFHLKILDLHPKTSPFRGEELSLEKVLQNTLITCPKAGLKTFSPSEFEKGEGNVERPTIMI